MDTELETIKRILDNLPKSCSIENKFIESDAEIINYKGYKFLFSIDEFTSEDFFRDNYPYSLGWNVAACTISDILASAGKPLFYGHSMSVPCSWDNNFIDLFSKGISEVLNQLSVGFIGGDTGISANWHYTGVVIGESSKPLTRKGAEPGQAIFMTGCAGAGNLEAALKLYDKNKINTEVLENYRFQVPVRKCESELVGQYATACIDSSDGLFNALNTIADINNVGFKISNVPYLSVGRYVCELLGQPCILLLLGECGEYELVFTIEKFRINELLEKAGEMNMSFTQIGEITDIPARKLITGSKEVDLSDFVIRARNYNQIQDYLYDLIEYAKSIENF